MNKNKIFIIAFLLGFVVQLKAMFTTKLPPAVAQRLSKENMLKAQKTLAKAKAEAEVQAKVAEIKKTLKIGEVYVYDSITGGGIIFANNLVNMCSTLKDMISDVSDTIGLYSVAISFENIEILHNLLQNCENAAEEKCSDEIAKTIQPFNFKTLVLFADCLHSLDIDAKKLPLDPFIKKIQETTNKLFDGKKLSDEESEILGSINPDFCHSIIGDKWDIFLEKMKLSIARNKKLSAGPNFMHLGENGYWVKFIVFSPNGKRLLVSNMHSGQENITIWTYVLGTDGTIYDKRTEKIFSDHPIWINDNEIVFICESGYGLKLQPVYRPPDEGTRIEKKEESFFFKCISLANNIIMIIYIDLGNNNKQGMEIYDIMTKSIKQYSLNIAEEAMKIFNFEKSFILFCKDPTKKKVLLYKFKLDDISSPPEKIAEFDVGKSPKISAHGGKKIAFVVGNNVEIYCLDTKNRITCNVGEYISALAFSPDHKILFVGCRNNKILIFSTATGEKIDELKGEDGQAFKKNLSIALSPDGNTLVVGSQLGENKFFVQSPNLFMWKWLPDDYLPIFKKLENKYLSFAARESLISLCYQSEKGTKPVPLALKADAKRAYDGLDPEVQKMLIDMGCVDVKQPAYNPTIQPTQPPIQTSQKTILQRLQDAGVAAKDWLNYVLKNLQGLR